MDKYPNRETENIWDSHAQWWRDTFASDNDKEYTEQILPACAAHVSGAQSVLDIGCGEGQIIRTALAGGVKTVVGIDSSPEMVRLARLRSGHNAHVLCCDASNLPFSSNTFAATTMVLVLEHVEEINTVFAEIARVLAPLGRLLLVLNHPFSQSPGSGWVDDQVFGEQYWAVSRYLGEEMTMESVDGKVEIPFVHRPFSAYLNAASQVGLRLESAVEPAPPQGYFGDSPRVASAYAIPRLVFLTWEK